MSEKGKSGIRFGGMAPAASSLDALYSTAPSPLAPWMRDRSLLPKRPPSPPKGEGSS